MFLFCFQILFFSVFQSKVGNQNQVFPKYKPHNSKKQSQSLDSNFMEKQNSIERLNSSLSSGKYQSQSSLFSFTNNN